MLSLFEIVIDPRSRGLSTKLLIAELISCTYCTYHTFFYLSLERSADFLYSSSLIDIFLQSVHIPSKKFLWSEKWKSFILSLFWCSLKLINFGLSLLQDDFIAWPSRMWQNYTLVGSVRKAKSFSKGSVFKSFWHLCKVLEKQCIGFL